MDKKEFITQLERAAVTVPHLPVTLAMVNYLAQDLKGGDPPWWKHALKAWEKRQFAAWSEAWTLLLSAIHFEALNDAESPFIRYFPSCGGTDEADPSGALAKFLGAPPKSFFDNLRTRHRRAHSRMRAPMWLLTAAAFFQKRELPYYVVEPNAGAGLNLGSNLSFSPKGFDETMVSARVGLDPAPLLLEDIAHRRWLTACLFPDDVNGIQALDKAADELIAAKRRDPNFIQLVSLAPEKAPKFMAKNIPAEEDVGLLVYNMATTSRMTDAQYQAFASEMAAVLAPWGDRALWLEIESVRGELYSTTYLLLAHRIIGGRLQNCILGRVDLDSRKVQENKDGIKFLASKG